VTNSINLLFLFNQNVWNLKSKYFSEWVVIFNSVIVSEFFL